MIWDSEKPSPNLLNSFELENPWQDLDRDLDLIEQNFESVLQTDIKPQPHRQIQVVSSLFFRNKAAYIVGRALIGIRAQTIRYTFITNRRFKTLCRHRYFRQ